MSYSSLLKKCYIRSVLAITIKSTYRYLMKKQFQYYTQSTDIIRKCQISGAHFIHHLLLTILKKQQLPIGQKIFVYLLLNLRVLTCKPECGKHSDMSNIVKSHYYIHGHFLYVVIVILFQHSVVAKKCFALSVCCILCMCI